VSLRTKAPCPRIDLEPPARDKHGYVHFPDSLGLGIEIDMDAIRRYRVNVEIKVKDSVFFSSNLQTL
jgi:hypothetical protein